MKTEATFARREFLKTATQAIATVTVCEGLPSAADGGETPNRSAGTLPMRTLGKTGLKLPILGYGGAALPTRWRNPLSYEDRVAQATAQRTARGGHSPRAARPACSTPCHRHAPARPD